MPLTPLERSVLDDSPNAFVLFAPDWTYLYINRAGATMVGREPESLLGKRFWDEYPEVVGSPMHAAYLSAMTERRTRTIEYYHPPLDLWIDILMYPVDDGLAVSFSDITQKKRDALRHEEATRQLAAAQEIAHFGTVAWDVIKGEVVWSPQTYRLLGLPPDFVPDIEGVLQLVVPEDRQSLADARAAALAHGTPYDLPLRMMHRDGTVRHIRLRAEVGQNGRGQTTRIFGVLQDVTEEHRRAEQQRQRDAQLQATQKLESLGVLAGGIAHDFNNLLVGILGNAGLAMLQLPPSSPALGVLHDIEQSAQRAADLTQQLLAYAGKGRFVVTTCDLSALVEEMASLMRSALSRKADLRLDLTKGLKPVEGDATQLRQVVMNLLTNASEALEDRPGTIRLATGMQRVDATYRESTVSGDQVPDGEYVFLEVSDNGVGMPPETVARIFEPFFTTKFAGRGLGLAATLGIVRGHEGFLKVYSEPGSGTTFKLLFPARDAAPSPEPVAATDAWQGEGTILLVDDDKAVRKVARSLLERRGFTVVEASDGEETLAAFATLRDQVRLVLLDLTMPHMDGEETFRQLRLADPKVRVMLMSGYNHQDVTSQFAGKGLVGFLQKPFRAAEFYRRVGEALALF